MFAERFMCKNSGLNIYGSRLVSLNEGQRELLFLVDKETNDLAYPELFASQLFMRKIHLGLPKSLRITGIYSYSLKSDAFLLVVACPMERASSTSTPTSSSSSAAATTASGGGGVGGVGGVEVQVVGTIAVDVVTSSVEAAAVAAEAEAQEAVHMYNYKVVLLGEGEGGDEVSLMLLQDLSLEYRPLDVAKTPYVHRPFLIVCGSDQSLHAYELDTHGLLHRSSMRDQVKTSWEARLGFASSAASSSLSLPLALVLEEVGEHETQAVLGYSSGLLVMDRSISTSNSTTSALLSPSQDYILGSPAGFSSGRRKSLRARISDEGLHESSSGGGGGGGGGAEALLSRKSLRSRSSDEGLHEAGGAAASSSADISPRNKTRSRSWSFSNNNNNNIMFKSTGAALLLDGAISCLSFLDHLHVVVGLAEGVALVVNLTTATASFLPGGGQGVPVQALAVDKGDEQNNIQGGIFVGFGDGTVIRVESRSRQQQQQQPGDASEYTHAFEEVWRTQLPFAVFGMAFGQHVHIASGGVVGGKVERTLSVVTQKTFHLFAFTGSER